MSTHKSEKRSFATGGRVAGLQGKSEEGYLEYTFKGEDGTYDILTRYLDEGDGECEASLLLNGKEIDKWIYNGTTDFDAEAMRSRIVEKVNLKNGDVLRWHVKKSMAESGRLDYFEIIPSGMTEIKSQTDREIKVFIDGTEIKHTDVKPVLKTGRTLIPLSAINGIAGFETLYDESAKKAIIKKDGKIVEMFISEGYAMLDGKDISYYVFFKHMPHLSYDIPAQFSGSTLMTPIRFVAESFGMNVDWKDYTVIITEKAPVTQ